MIRLITVGRVKSGPFATAIADYTKRCGRFARLETIELRDSNSEREGKAILAALGNARCIVCDERGEHWDSPQMAAELGAHGSIDFIIGGPDGLDPSVRKRGDAILAMSGFTLPHEMARLVLMEQIYRGFTILGGHPYHR
jgi:23S rRNA (pseudouridine1915-N3)-methyltransferase